jgi:glycosyltransferase involved in cell wall biosynthesis
MAGGARSPAKGPQCESSHATIEGIEIYRYRAWTAGGRNGYLIEYASTLVSLLCLALKVYRSARFRVLQGCNPPDTIFLIALPFKPLGVKFVFDHHDLSPELDEVKCGRRGLIYKIVCLFERLTFRIANFTIATNKSHRQIAIERGKMRPEWVAVVETCVDLCEVSKTSPNFELNHDKRHLVVYVGCMEIQDGVRLLIESIEYLVKPRGRNNTHFVLIGTGSGVPPLKTMVREAYLEDCVEFTGLIPHESVGILYFESGCMRRARPIECPE